MMQKKCNDVMVKTTRPWSSARLDHMNVFPFNMRYFFKTHLYFIKVYNVVFKYIVNQNAYQLFWSSHSKLMHFVWLPIIQYQTYCLYPPAAAIIDGKCLNCEKCHYLQLRWTETIRLKSAQTKKTVGHRTVHFSVNFSTKSNNLLTNPGLIIKKTAVWKAI